MWIKCIFLSLFILNIYKVESLDSCTNKYKAITLKLSQKNEGIYNLRDLNNTVDLNECSCAKPCFRKCCAEGYYFREEGKLCIQDENVTTNFSRFLEEQDIANKFDIIIGVTCLENYYQDPKDTFEIRKNGDMYIIPTGEVIPGDEFCVDYFEDKGVYGIICFPVSYEQMTVATNTAGIFL
ncbi:hypothetical protein QE152_g9678 [Popillia japonica]|uniref:Methuselah N-terminal domain-containing protein n=1 Tax=Popillia japonica TaxID=7064 RepID=A0AAW1LU13_POPJA